jgi:hypothetical protein
VSRLRRLRSFWRSYLPAGTRRKPGYPVRSASISTKARGTRTPATATTVGSSSYSLRGVLLGDRFVQTYQPPANSFTVPGVSGLEMVARGGSGEPRESATWLEKIRSGEVNVTLYPSGRVTVEPRESAGSDE